MTTINDTYINALLADATYALEVDEGSIPDGFGGTALEDLLSNRMTPTLAKYIADNFTVVTHIETDDETDSGFDATVWSNNITGEVYVSMRGTEGVTDFVTDIDLTISGLARAQIEDMVNWWLKSTTPAGEDAEQIRLVGGIFVPWFSVEGTGVLSDISNIAGVNGHSLGGHLATAFTRLFGGVLDIDHSYTYNSAGFTFTSELLFDNIELLLGEGVSLGRYPNESEQSNYFAENGINVTTRTFFNGQEGLRIPLFNEEGTGFPNHFMYKLTDTLTLGQLIYDIDNSFDISEMNGLIKSGSSEAENPLENILDSLRHLFIGESIVSTPIGDVDKSATSRVSYHENINELRSLLFDIEGNLKHLYEGINFESLHNTLASEIKVKALGFSLESPEDAIAYRYALRELNPFVIIGNSSIYELIHNENNELDLDNFSEEYLNDASEFLALKNELSIEDRGSKTGNSTSSKIYQKLDSNGMQDFEFKISGIGPGGPRDNFFIFGGDGADNIEGGNRNDHLYGNDGDDELDGKEGSDLLEGNHGNDTLWGIATDGSDDKASDILRGGIGNDTYHVGLGDIIEDSDGQGTIMVDGQAIDISNLSRVVNGSDLFTNNNETAPLKLKLQADGTLQAIGSYFEIRNFEDGDFGITLDDYATATYDHLIVGDGNDNALSPDNTQLGSVEIQGLGGNDDIEGGLNNDLLNGGLGDDEIFGDEGDDILLGDEGSDRLHGEIGNDVIDGGLGRDLLLGHEDKDMLSGGGGDDLLAGGEQDDFLEGDAGSDILLGGSGIDAMFGGEGNDVLIGDREGFFPDNNWSFTVNDSTPGELGGNMITFNGVTLFDGVNPYGDLLRGGAGEDYLFGEHGNDQLYGDEDNDDLIAGEGDDFLDGGSGNDFLAGENGNDVLIGGAGNDELQGGAGNDNLTDEEGDNHLFGNDGDDVINAGFGNDVIDGGAGADVINAGDGNNTIIGGTGNDILIGGDGDDQIDGNADDDHILAGDGIDTVNGGSGNDFIDGGAGADAQLAGLDGDDEIHGGDGDDTNIQGNDGDDILYGDAGNDVLFGQVGNDQLFGGEGNDQLVGDVGQDQLDGGTGDDVLFGQADNDILNGGTGIDFLNAGEGDDTLSGGADNDTLIGENGNDVLFGDDGDDFLQGDAGNDSLNGGKGNDVLLGVSGIDALSGGAGNDQLQGGDDGDFLNGDADDDTLFGDGGSDVLHGGTGNDVMFGDAGDDVFRFEIGDGIDRIIEQGDTLGDSILLGLGINPSGTFILRENNDLVIMHDQNATDRLIVQDWFVSVSNKLNHIEFNDGTIWDQATIESNVNLAPTANDDSINALEDTNNIILASTLIANDTDPNGDPLSIYSVSNAVNGVVSLNQNGDVVFTPNQDYVGTASFDYTMTDGRGGYDTATATVNVQNVNDAPVANPDTASVLVLKPTDITVPPNGDPVLIGDDETLVNTTVASRQSDPRAASLASGGYVVVWSGNTEAGTVDNTGIAGQLYDASGNKVNTEFMINTDESFGQSFPSVSGLSDGGFIVVWKSQGLNYRDSNSNDGVAAQRYDAAGNRVGSEFRVDILAPGDTNSIIHPVVTGLDNGGYAITWLEFNGISSSTSNVMARVYDSSDSPVGNELNVNTTGVPLSADPEITSLNDGGFLVTWSATGVDGSEIYYQRYDASFSPIDSQILVNTNTLNSQSRPSVTTLQDGKFLITWDSSDPATGDTTDSSIAGQLFQADGTLVGSEFLVNTTTQGSQINSRVTATSNGGFIVTWESTNFSSDWSVVAQRFDVNGIKVNDEFVVNEVNNSIQILPDVISLADGEFAFVYQSDDPSIGDPDVGITTNDLGIVVREYRFEVPIPTDNQMNIDVLSNDTDVDDNILTFSLDSVTLQGNRGEASIVNNQIFYDAGSDYESLDEGDTDTVTIDYTMSDDDGASSSSTVTLTIIGVNDLPFIEGDITDQVTYEDAPFNFSVSPNIYKDPDADDSLFFSASLSDDNALPNWLSFDFNSLTFSGTPENDDVGVINVAVKGTDSLGESAIAGFSLTVNNTNDTPTLVNAINDQFIQTQSPYLFTVPANTFNDVDLGDVLTYSAILDNGDPLPNWLSFDPTIRQFSGTPGNSNNGILSIQQIATDTSGQSVTDSFQLEINALPETGLDEFDIVKDTNLTISAADLLSNDSDRDNDALTITGVSDGVGGSVSFDANNDITFSPMTDFIGEGNFTYTVNDGRGGLTSQLVQVNVFNTVNGDAGDNVLIGTDVNDLMDGGAGNDTLEALAGNDLLIGGTGNDTLIGGTGDDTYQFSHGDGNDIIIEDDTTATGGDVVQFSSDIASPDVQIITDGKDLVLNIKDSSDSVILQGWVSGSSGYPVNVSFEFGDGTFLSAQDLDFRQKLKTDKGSATVRGSRFNDRLYGDNRDNPMIGKDGNDVIDGGAGNDSMEGGSGNDTYEFTAGFGNDTIIENDATLGNADTVAFGSGVSPIDLMFERLADSLRVSQISTTDTIDVQDWFLGTEHQTEVFRTSDGSMLLNTQVDQLIQAMAVFSIDTGLDWNNAIQQQPDQVEAILAASWQTA